MRRASCHLLGAVLLAAAGSAFAQSASEPRYSSRYDDCVNRSQGATFAVIECMTEELKVWDAELNQQYRAIRAKLEGARRNGFDAAQLAWLDFRKANCGFYYDPDGGTVARVNANGCMLEMTARRVVELRAIRSMVDQ